MTEHSSSRKLQQSLPEKLRSAWLLMAAILVSGGLALGVTAHWYRDFLMAGEQDQVRTRSAVFNRALGAGIERRTTLLEGLRSLALHEVGSEEDRHRRESHFEEFAGHLLQSIDGVRNVAMAPGGVISRVYPLAGNGAVPGHDLLHDQRPAVRRSVARTIASRRITLQGPYPLRQGGTGLVARLAVFRNGEFWGLVTMVIDFPALLREAGFAEVPADLLIAVIDGEDHFLFGDQDALVLKPVMQTVPLLEPRWQLAAAPRNGWHALVRQRLLLFETTGAVLLLLLALLAFQILNQRRQLKRQVRARTAELDRELAARQLSEAALLDSRQQLQAFLDALPDAALLMKTDGTVLVANRSLRQRLAVEPETPGQNNLLTALSPEMALDYKLMIDEVLRTGRSVRFADQSNDRTFANHIHPVIDSDDRVSRLAMLRIDITDRQTLEEHLRQAQKIEAVGTLSSGIAHEFNNIQTAIVGQASLLQMKLGAEHLLQKHVGQILKASERADELTRSLLSFSRHQVKKPVTVDVNDIVARLETVARPLLEPQCVLALEPASEPLPTLVDVALIEQTLLNLVLNARDAMP